MDDLYISKNAQGFEFWIDGDFTNYYNNPEFKIVKVKKDSELVGRLLYRNGEVFCELPLSLEAACKIDMILFKYEAEKKQKQKDSSRSSEVYAS